MDGRKRKDNDLTRVKDKDKDNDKKLRWDHLVVACLHVHLSGSWIQCVPVCVHTSMNKKFILTEAGVIQNDKKTKVPNFN